MDPITILVTAAAGKAAEHVTSQVSGWLGGKLKPNEVRQLAVRHWGCLLFECRWNLIQLSQCVRTARKEEKPGLPTMHSSFSQALLADLAKLSPYPAMLALAAKLVTEQRSLERFVALALNVGTQFVAVPAQGVAFQKVNADLLWINRAHTVIEDQLRLYGQLREFVVAEGKAAFKKEWEEVEATIVPLPLPQRAEQAADARVLGHTLNADNGEAVAATADIGETGNEAD